MKSRIGELVFFLYVAKLRGAKLIGKSAFEKELNEIINGPSHLLPKNNPGIYDQNDLLVALPIPYEQQFAFIS